MRPRAVLKSPAVRFALVVVTTLVVLVVLNVLPTYLGGEPVGVVRYSSASAVEREYGVRLWRPASLPAPYSWPPARLRVAVAHPGWVQFVFSGADGRSLVACQTLEAPSPAATPSRLLEPGQVLESSDVTIAGQLLRMRRLLLAEGIIVHEAWWKRGATSVMLRLRGSAEDLTRATRLALGNHR